VSVHKKKDSRWAAVFYLEGKQQWRYFGRRQEGELAARQFDIDRRKGKRTALVLDEKTFGEIAQAYLNTQPLSPKHRDSLRAILNVHVMDLFGQTPVTRLSMKDLVDLGQNLNGLALATRNRYKIYLSVKTTGMAGGGAWGRRPHTSNESTLLASLRFGRVPRFQGVVPHFSYGRATVDTIAGPVVLFKATDKVGGSLLEPVSHFH
jgi:hypothetical protein